MFRFLSSDPLHSDKQKKSEERYRVLYELFLELFGKALVAKILKLEIEFLLSEKPPLNYLTYTPLTYTEAVKNIYIHFNKEQRLVFQNYVFKCLLDVTYDEKTGKFTDCSGSLKQIVDILITEPQQSSLTKQLDALFHAMDTMGPDGQFQEKLLSFAAGFNIDLYDHLTKLGFRWTTAFQNSKTYQWVSENNLLYKAYKDNNLGEFRRLLSTPGGKTMALNAKCYLAGKSFNSPSYVQEIIFICIIQNKLEYIEELLKVHPDILNRYWSDSSTAIDYAVREQPKLAYQLLQRGVAKIEFIWAITYKLVVLDQPELAYQLLQEGIVDVNCFENIKPENINTYQLRRIICNQKDSKRLTEKPDIEEKLLVAIVRVLLYNKNKDYIADTFHCFRKTKEGLQIVHHAMLKNINPDQVHELIQLYPADFIKYKTNNGLSLVAFIIKHKKYQYLDIIKKIDPQIFKEQLLECFNLLLTNNALKDDKELVDIFKRFDLQNNDLTNNEEQVVNFHSDEAFAVNETDIDQVATFHF